MSSSKASCDEFSFRPVLPKTYTSSFDLPTACLVALGRYRTVHVEASVAQDNTTKSDLTRGLCSLEQRKAPNPLLLALWFRSLLCCCSICPSTMRSKGTSWLLNFLDPTRHCLCRPSNVQAETAIEQLPSSLGTEANAPGPEEDIFVAVEFSLALPPGFRETAVLPPKPAAARPGFGSFGATHHLFVLCWC